MFPSGNTGPSDHQHALRQYLLLCGRIIGYVVAVDLVTIVAWKVCWTLLTGASFDQNSQALPSTTISKLIMVVIDRALTCWSIHVDTWSKIDFSPLLAPICQSVLDIIFMAVGIYLVLQNTMSFPAMVFGFLFPWWIVAHNLYLRLLEVELRRRKELSDDVRAHLSKLTEMHGSWLRTLQHTFEVSAAMTALLSVSAFHLTCFALANYANTFNINDSSAIWPTVAYTVLISIFTPFIELAGFHGIMFGGSRSFDGKDMPRSLDEERNLVAIKTYLMMVIQSVSACFSFICTLRSGSDIGYYAGIFCSSLCRILLRLHFKLVGSKKKISRAVEPLARVVSVAHRSMKVEEGRLEDSKCDKERGGENIEQSNTKDGNECELHGSEASGAPSSYLVTPDKVIMGFSRAYSMITIQTGHIAAFLVVMGFVSTFPNSRWSVTFGYISPASLCTRFAVAIALSAFVDPLCVYIDASTGMVDYVRGVEYFQSGGFMKQAVMVSFIVLCAGCATYCFTDAGDLLGYLPNPMYRP